MPPKLQAAFNIQAKSRFSLPGRTNTTTSPMYIVGKHGFLRRLSCISIDSHIPLRTDRRGLTRLFEDKVMWIDHILHPNLLRFGLVFTTSAVTGKILKTWRFNGSSTSDVTDYTKYVLNGIL